MEKELRGCGKAPGRCVGQGGAPDAGSAALAVVAMAEYERGTKEGRYLTPLKDVLAYLLWLQEPNGDFVHIYEVDRDLRSPVRLLYYSGEAALGLIEAYRVLEDPALVEPIARLFGAMLAMIFILAWAKGCSPLEVFSAKADKLFVQTIRKHKHE